MLPDQSPEAVQLLALTELQVSVVAPPEATLVGLAARLTVGRLEETLTVTESLADPPLPLQLILKVLFAVRLEMV